MSTWLAEVFVAPAWLWALAAPLLAWPLAMWWRRRRHRQRLLWAGPRHAHPTGRTPIWLALAGLALAIVAAARPRWGEPTGRIQSQPMDVVVCLDVSRSMWARDARGPTGAWSRLQRAQAELADLGRRLQGDRLALVAFAGEATLRCPLTADGGSFARLAADTDPLAVRRGGTDLAAAIGAAGDVIQRHGLGPAAVVLVTDGEDHGDAGAAAARALAARGITVHCVALGTAGGAKIPLPEGGFVRDQNGQDVITTQQADSLAPIAAAGGGIVVTADGAEATTIGDLYDRQIAPVRRQAIQDARIARKPQRFQWPLFAAIAAWLAALGLGQRRWQGRQRGQQPRANGPRGDGRP